MGKIINPHERLTFIDYISISNLNTTLGTYTLTFTFLYLICGVVSFTGSLIPSILVFTAYTFDNISGISDEDIINKPKRYIFRKRYGNICTFLALLLFLLLLSYSFNHSIVLGFAVLVPEVSVIFYAVNLEKFGIPRIKKIFLLKNLYTALIWIFVVVVLPLIYLNQSTNLQVLFVMIQLFIAIFINLNVCDINDIKGDIENGVKTLPSLIGRENTLKLCIIINIMFSICTLIFFSKFLFSIGLLSFYAANLFTTIYLLYYFFKRDTNIRNELADLILLIPFLVLVMQKIILMF